ncbi:neocarzinostatin apoprotein domain-containing protein [Yinghuangia aomiensis]
MQSATSAVRRGGAILACAAASLGLAVVAAPSAAAAGTVSVSPATGLTGGQEVTVTAAGFGAGDTLIFAQRAAGASGQDGCAAGGAVTKKADANGGATATLKIVVGPVGTKGGACDAAHPCEVAVTDLSTIGQAGGPTVATKSITFAGGGSTPSKPASSSGSTSGSNPSKSASPAPGSELAHTGGDGGQTVLIAAVSGALVLFGGIVMLAVRRRGARAAH